MGVERYDVWFEWGPAGVVALGGPGTVVVVVDVLRFSTAVEAAASSGVAVHPYRWRDPSAETFAAGVGAVLADGGAGRPSLSPASLVALDAGSRVVLPSPNGATCAALAAEAGATVVAACLRNAAAVARSLGDHADPASTTTGSGDVVVIACGERWPDGTLRPAVEDLLGAGAVIAGLPDAWSRSPEAELTEAAWTAARASGRVHELVAASPSGREQVTRRWDADLAYALQVDASEVVPTLVDGAFVDTRVSADGWYFPLL